MRLPGSPKYLELMEKRNNKSTKVKIDSIEVIY